MLPSAVAKRRTTTTQRGDSVIALGLQATAGHALEMATPPASAWAKHKEDGNNAYRSGDIKAAIRAYSAALGSADLTDDKERATLLSNRAQALLRTDEHAAAVEDCTAALALDPTNIKALFRRAAAMEAMGAKKDAIQDYQRVLEIDAAVVDARKALVRLGVQPKPSPSAASPGGSGGRRDGKSAPLRLTSEEMKSLQEARAAIAHLEAQLSQAQQRRGEAERKLQLNRICAAEVTKSSESSAVYRHVGKAFLRSTRPETTVRLDDEAAELEKRSKLAERTADMLRRQLEEASTAHDELVKTLQRTAAGRK